MASLDLHSELYRILKAVSRSFYLSMVFLPKAMRPSISLAYLLARATDSVADSTNLDGEVLLTTLQRMKSAIQGDLSPAERVALQHKLSGDFAQAQKHASEAELLQQFEACLCLLEQSPLGEAQLIRSVLNTIIEGQSWDLSFFKDNKQVSSNKQTQDYTYMVAGCVGEFWTDLGLLCLGKKGFCPDGEPATMKERGIHYGCGLQLVNILRDYKEDAQNGRAYLLDESRDKWLHTAYNHLQEGISYSLQLASLRLRFTSVLPALLGMKTLNLISLQEEGSNRKAKISRAQVYATMLEALTLCLWRRAPH